MTVRTIVVPGSVTSISTMKTPGLVVPSKPAVITQSSPGDSSVCHSYINTSYPLYLPVTAASQTLSTQHLGPVVKPLWVIRILLLLSNHHHLSVVLRQREVSVGCVWVQCEFTGIWRTRHEQKYTDEVNLSDMSYLNNVGLCALVCCVSTHTIVERPSKGWVAPP